MVVATEEAGVKILPIITGLVQASWLGQAARGG